MSQAKQNYRLFKTVPRRVVNETLRLAVFIEGFMSADECRRIIDLSEDYAELAGGTGVKGKIDQMRDSKIRFVRPDDNSEWVFEKLETACLKLNLKYGFELDGFFDGFQVATYEPGGHYDWHIDLGGQISSARKLSMSVQLSNGDDYEGGDFTFQTATDQPAPRSIGSLIVFPSYLVHRVEPVTKGKRLSLVSWIAGPPFR